MTTQFRLVPHSKRLDVAIVEVWRDDEFVAGIYPTDEGIKIVSKHLGLVIRENMSPPPALIVEFIRT
jgi:hypothetical protein